jgi:hypothetical protein
VTAHAPAPPEPHTAPQLHDHPPAHTHAGGEPLAHCLFVDVRTRDELSARLLHCIASEVVFRSVSPDEALLELRKGVLPAGEAAKGASRGGAPLGMEMLSSRIERVAAKKNLGNVLASAFTKDQSSKAKLEAKAVELDRSGAFGAELRERLASVLVRHYDSACAQHCSFDMRECSEEEREQHRSACRFRPIVCANPRCGVCVSAHEMGAHDAACPFKMVACTRGCGLKLPRQQMAEHVQGTCGRRPAVCPFSAIGCGAACTQEELPAHLAAHANQHLLFALARINSQQATISALAADLADVRARTHATEAECAAYRRELGALTRDVSHTMQKEHKEVSAALQKEHTAVQKQLASSEAHIKKVETAVSKQGTELRTVEKDLKAAVNKLANDHLKVKATVDAAITPRR